MTRTKEPKTGLKISLVAIALWVILLAVGATIAHTAVNPTPKQVSVSFFQNQEPAAKAAGATLKSVTCTSTKWYHIFKCDITFVPKGKKASVCLSQYIHTSGRKLHGRLFHEWFPVWACRTKPTSVPKPYPGDVGPPGA